MKKNDYLLLAATGAYSFLFYQQNAGINFLLFNFLFLSILIIRNVKLLAYHKWLWAAGLCLISSACVFIHSSALSIIANIFSLLLVSAFSFNIATSAIFSLFFSFFSIASSIIYIVVDAVVRYQSKNNANASKHGGKTLAVLLVLVLSILFFSMYKTSNPLFAENTKWINLDFISPQWIFFTVGGFLLMYALFYHKVIQSIEQWENNLPVINAVSENPLHEKQFETERFAGLLLFIVLNLMLVILNAGDIQTLYFNGGLPKNISHSDFVHNGVGMIILSIIIATALMMFLFRKEFNGIKNNRALVICIYAWIIQNLLMLSSTAIRNQIYIHDYNFTYKRIGVYVWLFLAVIGLMLMFWKIYRQRSNWYLIRTNVAVWLTALVLSSTINWDKLITNYNIGNKALKDVDFYYLLSLSDANIPELIEVTRHRDFQSINNHMKNYTESYIRGEYYHDTYAELLSRKVKDYLRNRCSHWKSFDLREQQVYNSIYNIK